MSLRWLAYLLIVCASFGGAAADPRPTTLRGRVTDVMGRPIAGARVHVLASDGARVEGTTSKDGRYSVTLTSGGAYKVVFALEGVHAFRTALVEPGEATTLDIEVETDVGGGEVIRIVDRKLAPPKVPAKAKAPPRQALPYSEEAIKRDAWARAWLLLDVDATGTVTRLKLLKAPGFDLDRIAIEQGLALRFEPARDASGRSVRTYVVYSMEWPSWGWVIQGNGIALRPNDVDALHAWSRTTADGRLRDDVVPVGQATGGGRAPRATGATAPGERIVSGNNVGRAYWATPPAISFSHSLERVPCLGSTGLNLDLRNRAYRDCSTYDLSQVDALPWITRATVATAVAALAQQRGSESVVARSSPSRVPDIVTTSLTGALLVGVVVAHVRFEHWNHEVSTFRPQHPDDMDAFDDAIRNRRRWVNVRTGMAVGAVITGAVSVFLWTRDAPASSFSVQPTTGGAAASFATTF